MTAPASIVITTLALASGLSVGQSISVTQAEQKPIRQAHVFADKAQLISLTIQPPLTKEIRGKLFRVAGDILAPTTETISFKPSGEATTSIQIDFPPLDIVTHYLLLLDLPKQQSIRITVHPTTLLDSLESQTRKTPLTLVNPPAGLASALGEIGIKFSIADAAPSSALGTVLLFQEQPAHTAPIDAPRVILASPSNDREVWIERKKASWKIRIPRSFLEDRTFTSANDQALLKRVLLDTPEPF